MARKKKHADEGESGFTDVSDAEPDEVVAEHATRASAQFNGGGPWPTDLLLERYVGGTPVQRS